MPGTSWMYSLPKGRFEIANGYSGSYAKRMVVLTGWISDPISLVKCVARLSRIACLYERDGTTNGMLLNN